MARAKSSPPKKNRKTGKGASTSKSPKSTTKESTSKDATTTKEKTRTTQSQQHQRRSVLIGIGSKQFKVNYGVIKEIKRLQRSTQFCIPKAPFGRLLREIVQSYCQRYDMHMTINAVLALHEASEMYLVGVMEDSNICAQHAKRITVRPDDMNLALTLREH